MRWAFHPEALQEFEASARYYAERDPRLALRFVEAIEDAITRIIEAPAAWRVLDESALRRCRTRGFPYGVLYSVEADGILIVAVMHGSRKPRYWTRRID